MMKTIDPILLRNTLGCFITGVTVVTCRDEDGKAHGMTANSFASVSLDPPLVLWSIGRNASCFDAFECAKYFAIHILHSGQESISRHFATKNPDKFATIEHENGIGDTPLLTDYSARLVCSVEHRYPGGDHIILVGRIVYFDGGDHSPLAVHKGQYKTLA